MAKDKIQSCFMDEQPKFYTQVMHNDSEIAVIRAITEEDREILNIKGGVSFSEVDGQIKSFIAKPKSYENYLIVIALGGTVDGMNMKKGREGWIFDRKITFDSVSMLNPEYRKSILATVIKHINDWDENKEAILKN